MNNLIRILAPTLTALIILSCEGLGDMQDPSKAQNDNGYYGDVESVTTLYYHFVSSNESKDSIKTYSGRIVQNYDINGKTVSQISFDEHDKIISQQFFDYEYDKHGKIVTKTINYRNDKEVTKTHKSFLKYDKKERLTRVISHHSYNNSSEVQIARIDTTDHRYDSKGRVIASITYDSGFIMAKTIRTWTSFDAIATNKHESHSDGHSHYYLNQTYTYNKDKVITESTNHTIRINNDRRVETTYHVKHNYDSKGNLISTNTYQDDKLVQTYECEYDSRGNHTRETIYNYVEGVKTPLEMTEYQITYRD